MKNLWATWSKSTVAEWTADLSLARYDPEKLLHWCLGVLELGESCEVFQVQEAPQVRYLRERDGDIRRLIERRVRDEGVMDLFGFVTGWQPINGSHFRCRGRVIYFDQTGRLVEGSVENLGDLLGELRPEETDSPYIKACLPLWVHGLAFPLAARRPGVRFYRSGMVVVRFQLTTDVWFPWVSGCLEDRTVGFADVLAARRGTRPGKYPNPLAQRHTPRLNRFLTGVAELTAEVDGLWTLNEQKCYAGLRFMLSADGIRLNARLPENMPELTPSS